MTPEENRKHWTPRQWRRHADLYPTGSKERALCLYRAGVLTFEQAAKIANEDTK